jgi:pyruvate dehydrogenase E1 component beta subunit
MGTQVIEIREAIRQAMDEEMARDPNVLILGEEVAEYNGAYKVTKGMLEKWGPERIIDTPIAELGFAGIGIGAAMTGLRPIVEFMSFNFSFVAFDQIISNACKMYYMSGGRFKVPIVFRGPNGAAVQVSCQHSHCVESLYSHFPGLKVVYANTAYDAKGLMKTAIRDDNPVLFLESELSYGNKMEIPTEHYLIPFGKAVYRQHGDDLTLITYGQIMPVVVEAAKELAKKGIKCEVIDLRSIKPLDITTIAESVRKTGKCIVIEEGHRFCGMAAEISAQIMEHCFDFLDGPVQRVCQMETPMPYSKPLEKATVPTVDRILAAAGQIIKLRK